MSVISWLCTPTNFEVVKELARDLQAWFSCRHQNLFEPIGYSQSEDLKNLYLILPLLRNGNISEYVSRRPLRTQDRLDLVRYEM